MDELEGMGRGAQVCLTSCAHYMYFFLSLYILIYFSFLLTHLLEIKELGLERVRLNQMGIARGTRHLSREVVDLERSQSRRGTGARYHLFAEGNLEELEFGG